MHNDINMPFIRCAAGFLLKIGACLFRCPVNDFTFTVSRKNDRLHMYM